VIQAVGIGEQHIEESDGLFYLLVLVIDWVGVYQRYT
jgi:hypothetical protein